MIFLTGGRGLLGSTLAERLSLAHLPYLASATRGPAQPPFTLCDLQKPETYPSGDVRWDMAVHCATQLEGPGIYDGNMLMTRNVIDFCKQRGIRKMIFVSSSNAASPLQDEYSRSKRDSENLVKESGLETVIIRPTIIFSDRDTKNINQMMRLLKRFHVALIPGSGRHRVQPVAVEDVAELILKCVRNWDSSKNAAYDIGGGETLTYKEMISRMARALSTFYIPVYIPMPILYMMADAVSTLTGSRAFTRYSFRHFVTEKLMDNRPIEEKFGLRPRPLSEWLAEIKRRRR